MTTPRTTVAFAPTQTRDPILTSSRRVRPLRGGNAGSWSWSRMLTISAISDSSPTETWPAAAIVQAPLTNTRSPTIRDALGNAVRVVRAPISTSRPSTICALGAAAHLTPLPNRVPRPIRTPRRQPCRRALHLATTAEAMRATRATVARLYSTADAQRSRGIPTPATALDGGRTREVLRAGHEPHGGVSGSVSPSDRRRGRAHLVAHGQCAASPLPR